MRRRRGPIARGCLIVALVFGLAFWGLWQIDMFRQTVQIAFLSLVGGLWKLRGHTEVRMMPSVALGQDRQVIVYLPPGYGLPQNKNRHYPVLYLLHGFPDPGDGWVRFGLAPQIVDRAIVQHDLPPLLIVMPDSHGAIGRFGDGEYLDAPVGGSLPGTHLATFIVHDVPAWTDARYRTVPTAAGRFIAGESTGGYAAVNLGLQHPNVFGTLISLSGYFEADLNHFGRALWGPTPDPARIRAESPLAYVAAGNAAWQKVFVYLGNGRQDYSDVRAQSDRMAARFDSAGVPYAHHLIEGHHSWDQWRLTLLNALETVKPRLESAEEADVGSAAPAADSRTAPAAAVGGKP